MPVGRFTSRPLPKRNLDWLTKPVAALDFETTGLGSKDQPISWALAVIMPDLTIQRQTSQWVIPTCEINEGAFEVHGMTIEKLQSMPGAVGREAGIAKLVKQITDLHHLRMPIVGHNVRRFDWRIAEREAKEFGYVLPEMLLIDTLEMARVSPANLPSNKLGEVARHYGIEAFGSYHNAMVDAVVAGQLAFLMGREYDQAQSAEQDSNDGLWPNGPHMIH